MYYNKLLAVAMNRTDVRPDKYSPMKAQYQHHSVDVHHVHHNERCTGDTAHNTVARSASASGRRFSFCTLMDAKTLLFSSAVFVYASGAVFSVLYAVCNSSAQRTQTLQ